MGNFKDLASVLLVFLCITAIVIPADLHNILVYFFGCKVTAYNDNLIPYYKVTGIISGLTAIYLVYRF